MQANSQGVRVGEGSASSDIGNLALFGKLSESAGQFVDDVILEVAQTVEVYLRLGEFNAPGFGMIGLVDNGRHMQQGLRGDATVVQTDAAGVHVFVNQCDLHAKIGCVKSCGVSA